MGIVKMLSFLVILTVTLHACLSELDMVHRSEPCSETNSRNAYDSFLYHHLNKDIPTNPHDLIEWQKFITKIKTWDRPIQSFFPISEARLVKAGNLCISKKPLKFFTVYIKSKNQVTNVNFQEQYAILGCDIIERTCRPDHFEPNTNDATPDNNKPDCSKAMANASFIPFEELFEI
ncbi:hypothetical protein ABG768_008524 [Culter alburnus]|uniref:Uncharacterized protein n=1 Tax=Culter alburnus TaxID=194366 RepID=A0AAW1ZHD9_CULAL